MTLEQLLAATRSRLEAAIAERGQSQAALIDLRERAASGDEGVTREAVAAAVAARDAVDARIETLRGEVAAIEGEIVRDADLARLSEELTPVGAGAARAADAGGRPAYDGVARIGQEPGIYSRATDPRGVGRAFFADVIADFRGVRAATQRLERGFAEARVDYGEAAFTRSTSANFTGWVVPQYLVELNAPAAVAGRQFANLCTRRDLPPEGMTCYLSKITTASSAAAQANEADTVSETDMDDTQVSIPVRTVAGSQSVSRQAVERGTGVDDVAFGDLLAHYNAALDTVLLAGATNGLTNVATTVAYTDASPTGPELYPKLQGALSAAEAIFLGRCQSFVAVMHPRRWRWLATQMTSTWPMVAGAMMVPGAGVPMPDKMGAMIPGVSEAATIRGYLPDGTAVVTDANIATNLGAGTNEDEIYLVGPQECFLWEDPAAPMMIRAESQPKKLLLDLVLYGYYAFYLNRYAGGHQKIAGTGLVTPTF